MARGGLGLTVGLGKFLSGAELGDIRGGAQETSHHCVSGLYLSWVCGTHPHISAELGRVRKSKAGGILASPEQLRI